MQSRKVIVARDLRLPAARGAPSPAPARLRSASLRATQVDGVSGFFSNRDQMYQMATMPAKAVALTPYTIELSLGCEILPQELVAN